MYTSRATPVNGIHFPGAGQSTGPVVHFLTDDGSERAALDAALSSAGFRVQPLASTRLVRTPPDVLQPTCLVVDGEMLPPFVPLEQRAMPIWRPKATSPRPSGR